MLVHVVYFMKRKKKKKKKEKKRFQFLYLHFILSIKYPLSILHPVRLVFLIFSIKCCLTEVLEQPGGETPTLNVMVIRHQHHAKQLFSCLRGQQ